jgi:LysM repeat protein
VVTKALARFRASRLRRPALPAFAAGRVARYVAPAAFLVAVTAVVLIVRSTLRSNDKPASPTTSAALVVTTKAAPATRPRPAPAPKRYYVIQSGDTLEAIATRFATTVDALLRLNPGVKPTTLRPGEQVRIK